MLRSVLGRIAFLLVVVGGFSQVTSLAWADDFKTSGYGETRWRMRAAGEVDDQDVYGTMVLDGNGTATGFHLHGMATHDLEGLAPKDRYEPFAGLTDTYADQTHGYLYSAYLDLGKNATQFRLGRQWTYRGLTQSFDGASLRHDLSPWLRLTGVAGQPVRFYDVSNREDRLYGGGVRFLLASALELGGDYYWIRDFREGATAPWLWDELVVASATLRTQSLVLGGEASYDNNKPLRYTGRAALDLASFRLTGMAQYQPESLNDLVPEASTFYPVLGVSRPHQLYQVSLEQDVGDQVSLLAGGTVRFLDLRSDESAYNHDYTRYEAGFRIAPEVLGFAATLMGEVWQATGASDHQSVDLGLERKLGKAWSVQAGSDFSRFKYDLVTGQERQDVRGAYFKLRRKVARGIGLDLGVTFENDDTASYRVFDVAVRHSF